MPTQSSTLNSESPRNSDAGLVLTSIGYRGRPIRDLPFDDAAAVVPNDGGRVVGAPGSYVAGWIKRGPTGFIGTNKSCAAQTVHLPGIGLTVGFADGEEMRTEVSAKFRREGVTAELAAAGFAMRSWWTTRPTTRCIAACETCPASTCSRRRA